MLCVAFSVTFSVSSFSENLQHMYASIYLVLCGRPTLFLKRLVSLVFNSFLLSKLICSRATSLTHENLNFGEPAQNITNHVVTVSTFGYPLVYI